jgi:hypothetical protein
MKTLQPLTRCRASLCRGIYISSQTAATLHQLVTVLFCKATPASKPLEAIGQILLQFDLLVFRIEYKKLIINTDTLLKQNIAFYDFEKFGL